jgi:hypothetical protein
VWLGFTRSLGFGCGSLLHAVAKDIQVVIVITENVAQPAVTSPVIFIVVIIFRVRHHLGRSSTRQILDLEQPSFSIPPFRFLGQLRFRLWFPGCAYAKLFLLLDAVLLDHGLGSLFDLPLRHL